MHCVQGNKVTQLWNSILIKKRNIVFNYVFLYFISLKLRNTQNTKLGPVFIIICKLVVLSCCLPIFSCGKSLGGLA